MIRGLHHVAIATDDAERMLAFYRDVLGLEVVIDYTWPEGTAVADRITALPHSSARQIILRKGNAYFEIFQYLSPRPGPGDPARRVCDPGITHLCFDVVDLNSEYERLSDAGMTFHCPPQDVAAGVRTTYGRDPDGNVIELQEVTSGEHRISLPPLAYRAQPRLPAPSISAGSCAADTPRSAGLSACTTVRPGVWVRCHVRLRKPARSSSRRAVPLG